jgi:hypothetical protein
MSSTYQLEQLFRNDLADSIGPVERYRRKVRPFLILKNIISFLLIVFITVNVLNGFLRNGIPLPFLIFIGIIFFAFFWIASHQLLRIIRNKLAIETPSTGISIFQSLFLGICFAALAYFLGDTPVFVFPTDVTHNFETTAVFKVIGLFVTIVIISLPILHIGNKLNNKLNYKLKNVVVPKVAHLINRGLQYDASKYISLENFTQSQLYSTPNNKYAGSDYISGKIDDVNFQFSLLNAMEKRRNGSKTEIFQLFNGYFYIAELNKSFSSRIFIFPSLGGKFIGSIGNTIQRVGDPSKPPLLPIDNPEFEKQFKVLADDPVEAGHILSYSFIDRILHLKNDLKSDFSISFIGSHLFIAISTTDNLIYPNLFGELVKFEQVEELHQKLSMIFSIAKELNIAKI